MPARARGGVQSSARRVAVVADPRSIPKAARSTSGSTTAAAEAIAAKCRVDRREPQRAEAWFYLAGSYAPLVQWRVHSRRTSHGGARGQEDQGRARTRVEARSGAVRRVFRDRLVSLLRGRGAGRRQASPLAAAAPRRRPRKRICRRCCRRASGASWLGGEADFQLAQIYLWYENRPSDALASFESLDARYPANPIFLERIADAYDVVPARPRCEHARVAEAARSRARQSRRIVARDRSARRTQAARCHRASREKVITNVNPSMQLF